MAIFAAIPLLIKAAHEPGRIYLVSIAVYAASLILLYAASTTYHTFNISKKVNTILKKIDHMMISVLIAGSYTPICLLVLGGRMGWILLAIVWGFAIAGILIKAFWVFCRSGYLPYFISEWGGLVYLHLHNCSIPCRRRDLDGFSRRNHLYSWRSDLCTEISDF